MRQAAWLVGIGLVVGLLVALATTRVLRAQLFGVSPVDPLTLGSAVTVLIAVTALAAYGPAVRASRVDPLVAIRTECRFTWPYAAYRRPFSSGL